MPGRICFVRFTSKVLCLPGSCLRYGIERAEGLMDFLKPAWGGLQWSAWIPLSAGKELFRSHLTTEPGLYRVRVVQRDTLAYVGQTGRDLRERIRALSNHTFRPADNPPWNDPHTGAPGLWAWRIEDGLDYEVSVAGTSDPGSCNRLE